MSVDIRCDWCGAHCGEWRQYGDKKMCLLCASSQRDELLAACETLLGNFLRLRDAYGSGHVSMSAGAWEVQVALLQTVIASARKSTGNTNQGDSNV